MTQAQGAPVMHTYTRTYAHTFVLLHQDLATHAHSVNFGQARPACQLWPSPATTAHTRTSGISTHSLLRRASAILTTRQVFSKQVGMQAFTPLVSVAICSQVMHGESTGTGGHNCACWRAPASLNFCRVRSCSLAHACNRWPPSQV
jgi:hypothetical protein